IPAFTGASLTALAVSGDWWGPVAAVALAGFAFAFRMTSWHLQWRVPAPVRGWSVRGFDARRRRERSVFGRPRRGGDDDEGGPGGDDDEAASGHPDTDALTREAPGPTPVGFSRRHVGPVRARRGRRRSAVLPESAGLRGHRLEQAAGLRGGRRAVA